MGIEKSVMIVESLHIFIEFVGLQISVLKTDLSAYIFRDYAIGLRHSRVGHRYGINLETRCKRDSKANPRILTRGQCNRNLGFSLGQLTKYIS
jgi:hypothetical protein